MAIRPNQSTKLRHTLSIRQSDACRATSLRQDLAFPRRPPLLRLRLSVAAPSRSRRYYRKPHPAKKDHHLGNVMEVLDVCHDNDEMTGWTDDEDNDDNRSDASSSSSDSDESSFLPDFISRKTDSNLGEDGKRGPLDQVREYKQHSKQLHRRNRGVMQWKAPRTAAWMKHVAQRGQTKVANVFKHGERNGQGIETEV